MLQQERIIRWLPVPLTQEEFDAKASELAQAEIELANLTIQKAAVASEFKGKMDIVKQSLGLLAGIVDKRAENREVECEEHVNMDRKIVEIVRTDTGEIIDTRGITSADIQRTLNLRVMDDDDRM